MYVKSGKNGGTRFCGLAVEAAEWWEPECATMDKIRALIVDDSSVMRKIVERSLRQAGIELEKVVEAANGAEALAALQDNAVDLILCDINMPVMDGLEFVRRVGHGRKRQRRSDRDDHYRRQRIARGAGALRPALADTSASRSLPIR